MSQATYPFDTTGTAETNLVEGELHTLTMVNAAPYRIIIPTFAPFYLDNLLLEHVDLLGNRTPLDEGVHYYMGIPYIGATRSVGKPVYGGIPIIEQFAEGAIAVTYQTVGGDFVADPNYVYARLLEYVYNPRTTWWDNLTNVQELFPAVPHDTNLDDVTQVNLLFDVLNRMVDAILQAPNNVPGEYVAHMLDAGLHPQTAQDLGISPYASFDMATDEEVIRGEVMTENGKERVVTFRQVQLYLRSLGLIS
jgi:FAD/FMN-containing dehydrogenase